MFAKALPICCLLAVTLGGARPIAAAPGDTIRRVVEAERRGDCAATADVPVSDVETLVAAARLARCLVDEGDFEGAVRLVGAVDASSVPGSGIALAELGWLPELRARVALHAGRASEAVAAFSALRRGAGRQPAGVRARLAYLHALSLEAAGDRAEAIEVYRELMYQYPATAWALRAQLAVPPDVPDASRALEMAEHALAARNYPATEALLVLAACAAPVPCAPHDAVSAGDPARYEAAYRLGHLLYRYRRELVDRALPWLETVVHYGGARVSDARHDYARAVVRLGRYDEARRALREFARLHPDDPRADGAVYEAAWLLLEEDRHEEAARAFADYVRDGGARRADAAWWRGWAHAQAGRCREAVAAWAELRDAKARYWTAVCDAHDGRSEAADSAWRAVVDNDPWGYYALLARRRLGEAPIPAVVSQAPGPGRAIAGAAAVAAGLGLSDEARAVAAALPHPDDPFWRLAVEARRSDWVQWRAAWEASASASMPGSRQALDAWRLAHPRFYEETVVRVADREGIPAELVWAIMQKESAYDVRALSVSDAMGLMQVIPQTGEAIARTLGERYADGMLFEPYHAIRYGGWYLGALRRHFGGDIVLAIAGYNAGPVAVEAWVDRNGGRGLDEFVEEIPADQTRDYVRRVVSILARYAIAAGDTAVCGTPSAGGALPSTVGAAYGAVVDF